MKKDSPMQCIYNLHCVTISNIHTKSSFRSNPETVELVYNGVRGDRSIFASYPLNIKFSEKGNCQFRPIQLLEYQMVRALCKFDTLY